MCGRFALGVDANELQDQLARQYFGRAEPGADQDDQGTGGSPSTEDTSPSVQPSGSSLVGRIAAEQAAEDSDEGEGELAYAGGPKELRWGSQENQSRWRPRYNVAPKSGGVVVRRSKSGAYELAVLKWGLVPHWTKTPQEDPPSTINAQMESVFEGRPTWKVRDTKRCIVVAQGFYEWVTKGKDKTPNFIKRGDGKLMIFAGLWDYCDYKGNFDPVSTYTIITTPVNKQLRQIHSRMPAILDSPSDVETWLSNRPFDDKVKSLVKPFGGRLEFYPVDKGVGKVGNDSRDYIKPVAQKAGSLDTLFAKQKSTPSKPASDSYHPSSTPVKSEASEPKPKLAKEEEEESIMNPDEDTKLKTEQLEKIEEDEEVKAKVKEVTPKGKGKKREVETLELSSDDDDVEPAKEKKRKVSKSEKEEEIETKTDGQGNKKLDGFFKVLD